MHSHGGHSYRLGGMGQGRPFSRKGPIGGKGGRGQRGLSSPPRHGRRSATPELP